MAQSVPLCSALWRHNQYFFCRPDSPGIKDATVGIGAGPHALDAMKDFGLKLLAAGVVVSVVPHLVLLLVGRYIMHMNLGVLLGVSAGAGTATPSLQAVVEEARSSVPALGFTIPYALSNVLLTAWGPVIVALV